MLNKFTQLPFMIAIVIRVTTVNAKLIRDQSVQCGDDHMEVKLDFNEPFDGVVYTDNYYTKPECRWFANSTKSFIINIPTSTESSFPTTPYSCGVKHSQPTDELSVALIISPVKNLLVSGVSKTEVRCLYAGSDVTVQLAPLRVLNPNENLTGVVTGSGGTPTLRMQILDGHGIDGEVLTKASVGQKLTLDVELKNTAIYDFYVYSCFAHDGSNSSDASVQIIDANGCGVRLARAIDVPVHVNKPATGTSKHIYVHMYGFQFTSSQYVHFECQARSCLNKCKQKQCDENNEKLSSSARLYEHHQQQQQQSRKRRQYNDDASIDYKLRLKAILEMNSQTTQTQQLKSETSSDCFATILPMLIVSLALMSACIIIVLCFVFMENKKRTTPSQAHSDTNVSDNSSIESQICLEPNYSITNVWHSSKY